MHLLDKIEHGVYTALSLSAYSIVEIERDFGIRTTKKRRPFLHSGVSTFPFFSCILLRLSL